VAYWAFSQCRVKLDYQFHSLDQLNTDFLLPTAKRGLGCNKNLGFSLSLSQTKNGLGKAMLGTGLGIAHGGSEPITLDSAEALTSILHYLGPTPLWESTIYLRHASK
jgi:hypothetical protein